MKKSVGHVAFLSVDGITKLELYRYNGSVYQVKVDHYLDRDGRRVGPRFACYDTEQALERYYDTLGIAGIEVIA